MRKLLCSVALSALLSSMAFAHDRNTTQDPSATLNAQLDTKVLDSNSNYNSNANRNSNLNYNRNSSSSSSSARSNARANSTANSYSGATANPTANGSVANTNNFDYPSTQTIRNNTDAPDVVISGANTCALPVGGSTSILGFGFGVAATPTDKGCERRNNANALYALGYKSAAIELMCQDKEVAKAMSSAGTTCDQVAETQSPLYGQTAPAPKSLGRVSADTLNQAVLNDLRTAAK